MRVLYFGTYERAYPRNAQVISCLREGGVEVVEHHVPVWDGIEHKLSANARSAVKLAAAQIRLWRRPPVQFDALIVGYPGHADMRAAKHVADGRPVVFNPLVSLDDTIVGDRGLTSQDSVRARTARFVDRRAFRSADLVVADTAAHARFFAERFDLPGERLAVCYVGAEDRLFFPGPGRSTHEFDALFVGKLIPLHGVETILEAAALCPEIPFHIVGSGQLDEVLARLPSNVRHDPWVEYEQLPELYRSTGCALGIFGTSEKAARVIPNKAFQALACGAPLVTADTPAARELLADERDALLVPPGDPEALATAIRRIATDRELGAELGACGRATYVEHASEGALGSCWRSLLLQAVNNVSGNST